MEEEWLENSMQSFLKRETEERKGRGRQRILTKWQCIEQRGVRGLKRGWTVKDMKW